MHSHVFRLGGKLTCKKAAYCCEFLSFLTVLMLFHFYSITAAQDNMRLTV